MTQQDNQPSIQTLAALERATQRTARKHGREPTVEELAAEMGVSAQEVRRLIEAAQGTITVRPIERA
jgi:DNA-directed RNA polymerase sigma subunit (sigma70/sigma32)